MDTESITTIAQSTDPPTVTNQITSETHETTTTAGTTTPTSPIDPSKTVPNFKPTIPTVSSISCTTNTAAASASLDSTSTTSLASTTSTSTTVATETTDTASTEQDTERTIETGIIESSSTESDNSDAIIFPDEDSATSDKQVTFPPLIYQLMSSQGARIDYAMPGFVFPSEIKIYLNFPNSTIIVPGIIQANMDAQVNKTAVKEAPTNNSLDNTPSKEEFPENSNNKTTASTETPIRYIRNEKKTSEESSSGKDSSKTKHSGREAPPLQTSSNEARGKQVPEKEVPISETPPSIETLSTPQITPTTLALDKEAESTQTQSTELDTGILVVVTSSIETTTTQADLIVNINDFIDTFEENIDLSEKTPNSDFGQTTDQSVGQTSIHKIKCDEYSNFLKNSKKRMTREKNNLPFQMFIVGGVDSGEKEFPHMAALGYGYGEEKQWLCGGSLISEKFILTAAHCLSSKELGDVQVIRLGTTTLQTETLESMDYRVLRKIPHPLYATGQQYNDIALIEVDETVRFTEYILPICLDDGNDYTGIKLIATGWGRLQATGSVSKELQKVDLDYFPNEICQQKYSKVSKQDLPYGIDWQTQICAGSETEVKDSCQGDSGGPLQEKILGYNYLVGITSFGIGCGTPGIPGVYTKVSYYIPWIESVVWPFSG
nr:unnamed protein product [Callosobruchus chinensis]